MLVTLSGGAGAGKTTLAAALAAGAAEASVRVLHADDYYFQSRDHGVWIPDEAGALWLDVGDPRSVDFGRISRDSGAALAESSVVIVEGLFARHAAPPTPCTRFDVFVELPADLRLVRKIQRKCVRDGFPLDVLLRNYLEHLRAAHDRHIEPIRGDCDLTVDGGRPADDLAQQVWSEIRTKQRPVRASPHSALATAGPELTTPAR